MELEEQLKNEPIGITRSQLISIRYSLLNDYD
jgi:hypothetical protein